MALFPRDNDALQVNPPGGDAHITTRASDWLWFVFAFMLFSWIASWFWTFLFPPERTRIYRFIPMIVLGVATITYFLMASDLGWTLIRSELHSHRTRQIWYVRYIQWFINAPLVLLGLLSFAPLSTPFILTTLFYSWWYVVLGLVGALIASSYKWGLFVFGLLGLFFIWGTFARTAFLHGSFAYDGFKPGYFAGAAYISFIWMLYPICWGLSEGSNTISPTSEMVFYGILDLMAGPVFLFGFMGYLSQFNDEQVGLTGFPRADGAAPAMAPAPPAQKRPQPQPAPPPAPPAPNNA